MKKVEEMRAEYRREDIGCRRDPHYGTKLPRIAQAIGALGHRLVIGLETV